MTTNEYIFRYKSDADTFRNSNLYKFHEKVEKNLTILGVKVTTVFSATTNSIYMHFLGKCVRISDHGNGTQEIWKNIWVSDEFPLKSFYIDYLDLIFSVKQIRHLPFDSRIADNIERGRAINKMLSRENTHKTISKEDEAAIMEAVSRKFREKDDE